MYAAMLLYVPLTLLCVAALVLIAYVLDTTMIGWLPTAGMRPRGMALLMLFLIAANVSIGCVSLLLLIGLSKLFTRFRSESVYGLRLQPAQHKAFFELLERVCRKLRVRPPQECYLSPFSDTCIADRNVTDEDGRVRRNVRTLVLGAALLVHVRIDEFTTILCHEMAHAKAGDTRMCWMAARFYHALVSAIGLQLQEEAESQQNTWLNGLVRMGLMVYYRVFCVLYSADERWCELRADRMSATICGPQNVRNMLIKIHLAGYIPDLNIESLVFEYSENGQDMDNLYQEYRRRWEQLPAARLEAAENQMFLDRHSLYDSHPCLASRIRGLKGIEAKEIRGDKPATRLFIDWDRLEQAMTRGLMRRGRFLYRAYTARLFGGRN